MRGHVHVVIARTRLGKSPSGRVLDRVEKRRWFRWTVDVVVVRWVDRC